MATVTHATTALWNTTTGTGTNKNVTATPALFDLIVVIGGSSGLSGGVTSVTDNNADGLGTYSKIGTSFTGFSTTGDLSIWVRNSLVQSATSTVFTAAQNGSSGGGLDVYRISGMWQAGAGAVRSSGGQSTGTAATAPAPVLSETPLTGNPVITAVCAWHQPAGADCAYWLHCHGDQPGLRHPDDRAGYDVCLLGHNERDHHLGQHVSDRVRQHRDRAGYLRSPSDLCSARRCIPLGRSSRQGSASPGSTWGSEATSARWTGRSALARSSGTPGGPVNNPIPPPPPPTFGPPLGWSSPVGVRAVYVRTGLAMATLIPGVAAPPPATPAPVYPLRQAVRARYATHSPCREHHRIRFRRGHLRRRQREWLRQRERLQRRPGQ